MKKQEKILSRPPVEKAIRTDSHTKHSDSLWRQFRSNQDLLSCRLQKFYCAHRKRLSIGESKI